MATIQQINSSIIGGNFTNDQLDSIMMAVKFARNQISLKNKCLFTKGSKVKFVSSRSGKNITGTVTKINRKYIIVHEDNSFTNWRVPANMLESA